MGIGDIPEIVIEKTGPKFSPQLYIQRYTTVRDILAQTGDITKVIDFGCGEGKLLKYLKNVESIEEVVGVDISYSSLAAAARTARPIPWEYLCKRSRPLTVSYYMGSIDQLDARLKGFDAVVGIELIEHLHPDVLESMPRTIFEYIEPRMVILTTPNREFNALFPDLEGLRHWDHKFEWTRQEFRQWCLEQTRKYTQYVVELSGIGEPPTKDQHLGCCTQVATFRRSASSRSKLTASEVYDLEETIVYPSQ